MLTVKTTVLCGGYKYIEYVLYGISTYDTTSVTWDIKQRPEVVGFLVEGFIEQLWWMWSMGGTPLQTEALVLLD